MNTAQPPQFVYIRYVGIELESLGDVIFSPDIVVKIEFGDASEKPCVIKIWLGIQYLIEILYGKYVIFIKQCTTTGYHQTVGIELRSGVQRQSKQYEDQDFLHLLAGFVR